MFLCNGYPPLKNRQKCFRKRVLDQYLNDPETAGLWDERQELYRRLCDAGTKGNEEWYGQEKAKPVKKMRGGGMSAKPKPPGMKKGGEAMMDLLPKAKVPPKKMRGGGMAMKDKPPGMRGGGGQESQAD